jgi:hypothetical protein
MIAPQRIMLDLALMAIPSLFPDALDCLRQLRRGARTDPGPPVHTGPSDWFRRLSTRFPRDRPASWRKAGLHGGSSGLI